MNVFKGRGGRPRAACGTVNGHKGHKRRGEPSCDACAAAWSEAHPPRRPDPEAVERRKAAFRADPTDRRHGTTNGYSNLTCRCGRCRQAWAASCLAYLHASPEQMDKRRQRSYARRGTTPCPVPDGYFSASELARLLGVHISVPARTFTPSMTLESGRKVYAVADVRRQVDAKIAARWGTLLAKLDEAQAS